MQFLLEEDIFVVPNQNKLKQNYGDQIVKLKSNKLPKGLVSLESIFNSDDHAKKGKTNLLVSQEHYDSLEVAPGKNLKFGKVSTPLEKESYVQLFSRIC